MFFNSKNKFFREKLKFFFYCLKSNKDFYQLLNFLMFKFICKFQFLIFKVIRNQPKKENKIFFSKKFCLKFKFDNRFGYFHEIKNKYKQIDLIHEFLKSKNIRFLKDKSLVELGCGQGINLNILKRLKFKKLCGFDYNKEHIKFGKKYFNKKVDLEFADVLSEKFYIKKKFAYLVCLNFLSFVERKKQNFFFRNIKKISKKIIFVENYYQKKIKRRKFIYNILISEKFKIFKKKIYYPDKIVCLFYYNFD